MFHAPAAYLYEGKNSTAYYCLKDPEALVIFVHGFKGTSLETWDDFSSLLIEHPSFANCDLFFYGYESIKGQAFDQGQELLRFINNNHKPKSPFRNRNPKMYSKIVIAAHSLGAIVARFAILGSIEQNYDWRKMCKLVLFAPAHNGARIQSLIMDSLDGFYKVIGGITMFFLPIIDDLKPDSAALHRLRTETEDYRGGPEHMLLNASVLHVFGDRIVHNAPFCFDVFVKESPIRNHSHKSICKPMLINNYLLPIEIIRDQL